MKRMAHQGMTLSKGTCLSHVRFGRGGFLGCVGLGGGRAGGLGFSAGGGFVGEVLRGLPGVGGSTHNWTAGSPRQHTPPTPTPPCTPLR